MNPICAVLFLLWGITTASCAAQPVAPPAPSINNAILIEDAATSSIYLVNPNGMGRMTLAVNAMQPSWTWDGQHVIYVTKGQMQQIAVVNPNGTGVRQIGRVSNLPLMPQMGRNGMIAFIGGAAGGPAVFVMRADGTALRMIDQGQQVSLAPSGTWLAYTVQSGSPFHREIWRANVDGTGRRQLTFATDDPLYPDANAPAISPDEQYIAMFSGTEAGAAAIGYRNVAVMPSSGGSRQLATHCILADTPAAVNTTSDITGTCAAADNPFWFANGTLGMDVGFASGVETWAANRDGGDFHEFYPIGRGNVRIAMSSQKG